MRIELFGPNDKVLLLGEGNFSFSAALCKLRPDIRITATCYESSPVYKETSTNIDYLTSHDRRAITGVDATKLHVHPTLEREKFDKIAFNFPHVGGKMKINLNRDLLRDFFVSAANRLAVGGHVVVSLCNGQGGTMSDSPRRRPDDSWRIVEMAAHGNLLLDRVEPFEGDRFPGYKRVGYRSLDKGFNATGALVHIFKKCDPPDADNIRAPRQFRDKTEIEGVLSWSDLRIASGVETLLTGDEPTFELDVTFSVSGDFNDVDLFVTLFNFSSSLIVDVRFLGSYEFPDSSRVTRTYRITYGSGTLPLYRNRVIELHKTLITKIIEEHLHVVVTR